MIKKNPAKSDAFWKETERLAKQADQLPEWMGAGINLSQTHHVTFQEEAPPRRPVSGGKRRAR